jgi:hypothetical protein
VAPITSAIRRFRHEFEAKITRREAIPVAAEPAAAAADGEDHGVVVEPAAEPIAAGGHFDV